MVFQLLLLVPMLPEHAGGLGNLHVHGPYHRAHLLHPLLHLVQLLSYHVQLLPLLSDQAVHLLVHYIHHAPDVVYVEALKVLGVEPGRLIGSFPIFSREWET